ncbi:LLM class flavin-dependent oxidoreductase [Aminobacter aminovorans]|uniref:LLM class flavin-dependent oxidoreductase n=1 Tax=Aminobacter aminovorans TaxID=83263 RepID=UPI0028549E01|nr:LLM class flavin-dependent oxidoreductase [Aminobacter aminovorans]MDR7220655.1 alkanesulfonate monooxygenase SsuD/methylene tetrahydromethanopterin reductase-like flavin-dependent oxidoreductase (luciferase family) [Aminobacter aminovorans]
MKFSMIYEAQIAETHREAEQQVFREMAEQCVQLDRSGFDGVWCVEHHGLTQYSHMSAPETFLAFVAGQTKKLEIGHGVVCLPPAMNHPIKVAERVAMLDILSNGRVNFGVGKGGSQQEAGAFGYQLSELQPLIDESMYLIPRLFTEEMVEHDGQYIKFPARPVHPKPLQQPHPRMYMACTRWEAVVTAGSRGLGALVMGFGGPDEIKTKSDAYRKAFAERKAEDQVGFRPTEHLSALCPAIVLRDRDKARRIGLRGQRFFAEALSHWYQGGPKPEVDDMSPEEHLAALDKVREHKFAKLGEDKIAYNPQAYGYLDDINDAYGTPEDCIRYVERLFEAGADEIMFLSQMGTVPHEAIMETIELIGSEVIPHFRGKKLRIAAAE